MQQRICDVCGDPIPGQPLVQDICTLRCLVACMSMQIPSASEQHILAPETDGITVRFWPTVNQAAAASLRQLGSQLRVFDAAVAASGSRNCSQCTHWGTNGNGSTMVCRRMGLSGPWDNGFSTDCPFYERFHNHTE